MRCWCRHWFTKMDSLVSLRLRSSEKINFTLRYNFVGCWLLAHRNLWRRCCRCCHYHHIFARCGANWNGNRVERSKCLKCIQKKWKRKKTKIWIIHVPLSISMAIFFCYSAIAFSSPVSCTLDFLRFFPFVCFVFNIILEHGEFYCFDMLTFFPVHKYFIARSMSMSGWCFLRNCYFRHRFISGLWFSII